MINQEEISKALNTIICEYKKWQKIPVSITNSEIPGFNYMEYGDNEECIINIQPFFNISITYDSVYFSISLYCTDTNRQITIWDNEKDKESLNLIDPKSLRSQLKHKLKIVLGGY